MHAQFSKKSTELHPHPKLDWGVESHTMLLPPGAPALTFADSQTHCRNRQFRAGLVQVGSC